MQERLSEEQLWAEVARLQVCHLELEAHTQELQARVRQQEEEEKRQRRAWMQEVFAAGGEVDALMQTIDWSIYRLIPPFGDSLVM